MRPYGTSFALCADRASLTLRPNAPVEAPRTNGATLSLLTGKALRPAKATAAGNARYPAAANGDLYGVTQALLLGGGRFLHGGLIVSDVLL